MPPSTLTKVGSGPTLIIKAISNYLNQQEMPNNICYSPPHHRIEIPSDSHTSITLTVVADRILLSLLWRGTTVDTRPNTKLNRTPYRPRNEDWIATTLDPADPQLLTKLKTALEQHLGEHP